MKTSSFVSPNTFAQFLIWKSNQQQKLKEGLRAGHGKSGPKPSVNN